MSEEIKHEIPPEVEEAARKYIEHLARFETGEPVGCPECDAMVEGMRQVGRCVYLMPCRHRLWQGEIPKAWRRRS